MIFDFVLMVLLVTHLMLQWIYFLWIAIKKKCNADKPETIKHLSAKILGAIVAVGPQVKKKNLTNNDSIEWGLGSRGSYKIEIIFHC